MQAYGMPVSNVTASISKTVKGQQRDPGLPDPTIYIYGLSFRPYDWLQGWLRGSWRCCNKRSYASTLNSTKVH